MDLSPDVRVELLENPDNQDEWQMYVYGKDNRLMAVAEFSISDWLYFTAAVDEVENTLIRKGLL